MIHRFERHHLVYDGQKVKVDVQNTFMRSGPSRMLAISISGARLFFCSIDFAIFGQVAARLPRHNFERDLKNAYNKLI